MKKHWPIIAISIIFLALHFLPFTQMYHQDEYKWGMIVNPIFGENLKSNHPPLVSILYRGAGEVFGFENLRIVPVIFGLGVLLLAYFLAKRLYGGRAAIWTALILLFSTYNLIAGTQIDIDGALLPFAMLLTLYSYHRIDFSNLWKKENRLWISSALVAMVIGFMIKLAFLLVIAALATEFIIDKKPSRRLVFTLLYGLGAAAAMTAIIVLLVNKLFLIADSADFLRYINNFGVLNFAERNYFQVLFLTVKSLVLASPLLLVWYILAIRGKDDMRRYRFWIIFLAYNFIFYYILFDFTNRTIERYLMFLIVPGAMIGGAFLGTFDFRGTVKEISVRLGAFAGLSLALAYMFLKRTYDVLPLNPKSEYISRIRNLDFDFLIPISGGSGPIGFYSPVLWIIFMFIAIFGLSMAFRLVKNQSLRRDLLMLILVLSLAYNAILTTEFVSGFFHGSSDKIAKAVIGEAASNPEIKQVITYYDIGGYELNFAKKYYRRIYTDPMFANSTRGRLATFNGHYTIVDFPAIDKESLTWKYLSTCREIFNVRDKKISGYIFDCSTGNKKLFET